MPSCLRELFAACGTDTACRGDYTTEHYCFDSGARTEGTTVPVCSRNGDSVTLRVTKSDGSPCLAVRTYDVSPDQECELASFEWTDATGAIVATGIYGGTADHYAVTCAAGGETVSCSRQTAGCPFGNGELLYSTSYCPPGDCP